MSVYEILPPGEDESHYLVSASSAEDAKLCFGVPQVGSVTSKGTVVDANVSPLHRTDEWLVTVKYDPEEKT